MQELIQSSCLMFKPLTVSRSCHVKIEITINSWTLGMTIIVPLFEYEFSQYNWTTDSSMKQESTYLQAKIESMLYNTYMLELPPPSLAVWIWLNPMSWAFVLFGSILWRFTANGQILMFVYLGKRSHFRLSIGWKFRSNDEHFSVLLRAGSPIRQTSLGNYAASFHVELLFQQTLCQMCPA